MQTFKRIATVLALTLIWSSPCSFALAAEDATSQGLPSTAAANINEVPPLPDEAESGASSVLPDAGGEKPDGQTARGGGDPGWSPYDGPTSQPPEGVADTPRRFERQPPPQTAKPKKKKKKPLPKYDQYSLHEEAFLPDQRALTPREQRYMNMTHNWESRESYRNSYMEGGKLVFIHGADGGVPVIIAAPLQVVDIELEPGENVNEIVVGDSARWQVERGVAGNRTHIFVKPIDTGLETSVVVTTDKRAYHWRFVSRLRDFMPYVGFAYATEMKKEQARQFAKEEKEEKWRTTESGVDLAALNFNYVVKGDNVPWKPERVYDNGRQMYIQLPPRVSTADMPALMFKRGKKDGIVNYRVRGNAMEVDGIFPHLALVLGVGGDQELVEIFRQEEKKRPARNWNTDGEDDER